MGYFNRLRESVSEEVESKLIELGVLPAPRPDHELANDEEYDELTDEDKAFFGIDEGDYSCILDHDDYEVFDCD